jgi:hypothetical protein
MAKRSCLLVLTACLAGLLPTTAAGNITLATNPAGSEVLLYSPLQQQSRPLFAATRDPDRGFGPLKAIAPPPGVFDARAAVDDSGGAVTAWLSHDPRYTRLDQRPDRGFVSVGLGPPAQIFEEVPNRAISFAANGAGDAIVGWVFEPDRYVFRPRGGAFGEARTLPTGPGFLSGLSVDPDGTAHAFSTREHDDQSSDIYEATRPPGGDFGAAVPVAHLAQSGGVAFAAARNGRVLFLWNDGEVIKGIDRTPGGSFSAEFGVPTGLRSLDIEMTQSVVGADIAPSGAAAVAAELGGRFVVAARKPGSAFVASPAIRGYSPRVAVDDAGDVAAVWSSRDRAVRAMYRPAGNAHFGKPIVLAGPRPLAPGFEAPSVTIANSGRATTAWEQSDGARIKVIARDFAGSRPGRREVVGSLPSFVREGPRDACRPVGSRLIRSSRQARVFVAGDYFGCLFARGLPLNLTGFGETLQSPSAISLAGPLVAFTTQTQIKVVDLRDSETGINRTMDLGRDTFVAASRLRATGSVAWIACASRCTGAVKKLLFAWNRGVFLPHLLDSGRKIDAGSLRLRGSRLSWRHGGKLRRARLR